MIKVIKAGLYSSVQDLGRINYKSMGVPQGGAMDRYSLKKANTILGNQPTDACIEITMMGPKLQFTSNTYIAIAGAKFELFLDQKAIPHSEAVFVKANQELSFGKLISGIRAYLAISGGIQSSKILGSRSFLKNITPDQRLTKNSELPYPKSYIKPDIYAIARSNDFKGYLEAYKGPEFELLTPKQQEQISSSEFTISRLNDRMAYQLEPNIEAHQLNQITVPVLPGTVQFTPAGSLIVLMRDGQTTGGYPRVLQLKETSINLLAQMTTTSHFKLKILTKF